MFTGQSLILLSFRKFTLFLFYVYFTFWRFVQINDNDDLFLNMCKVSRQSEFKCSHCRQNSTVVQFLSMHPGHVIWFNLRAAVDRSLMMWLKGSEPCDVGCSSSASEVTTVIDCRQTPTTNKYTCSPDVIRQSLNHQVPHNRHSLHVCLVVISAGISFTFADDKTSNSDHERKYTDRLTWPGLHMLVYSYAGYISTCYKMVLICWFGRIQSTLKNRGHTYKLNKSLCTNTLRSDFTQLFLTQNLAGEGKMLTHSNIYMYGV